MELPDGLVRLLDGFGWLFLAFYFFGGLLAPILVTLFDLLNRFPEEAYWRGQSVFFYYFIKCHVGFLLVLSILPVLLGNARLDRVKRSGNADSRLGIRGEGKRRTGLKIARWALPFGLVWSIDAATIFLYFENVRGFETLGPIVLEDARWSLKVLLVLHAFSWLTYLLSCVVSSDEGRGPTAHKWAARLNLAPLIAAVALLISWW